MSSNLKKYLGRTNRQGSEKKDTIKIEVRNDSEQDSGEDEDTKHCICESRDYTTLMICCDYCSVWYHVECMEVTKADVKTIEKYACKICIRRDPKCKTEYKKESGKTGRKTEVGIPNSKDSKKKHQKNIDSYSNKIRHDKKEKKASSYNNDLKAKNKENGRERIESFSVLSASKYATNKEVKQEPKDEARTSKTCKALVLKSDVKSDVEREETITDHSQTEPNEASILPSLSAQQQRQLELQEANPNLRCGNCIGCFREKDCGKCFTCIQNQQKCCMDRICVQVEELLKERNEKKVDSELADCEDMTVEIETGGQLKSKKGRKPKHSRLPIKPEEMKRKKRIHKFSNVSGRDDSLNAQLTRAYCSWMRNRSKSRQLKEEQQCRGPGCISSSRVGSKYCSETCGMALAEQRMRVILPNRFDAFFVGEPTGQTSDSQQLKHSEEQVCTVKNKLDELEQWKDNLHQFVIALKDVHPNAQKQANDEENLVIGCPVCQSEFPLRESGKHIQSCFVRSERQTTYGTDYQIPNNQYNLYCEAYNKINQTYCKRLRYVCSEHYKEEYDLKVCGCPLDWYKGNSLQFNELFSSPDGIGIMGGEGYCQEKQKYCRDHKNWVQTAFSLIDNERMNLLNKLDELYEQKRSLQNIIIQRGNILTLLCNKSD